MNTLIFSRFLRSNIEKNRNFEKFAFSDFSLFSIHMDQKLTKFSDYDKTRGQKMIIDEPKTPYEYYDVRNNHF